jgi:hypothetical protein
MGQYYVIVNLDKHQYINPHNFGEGAKLMDFGASSGGAMTALAVLLADGNGRGGGDLYSNDPIIGSWAGDRIVVAGDYGDPFKFIPEDLQDKIFNIALEKVEISYPKKSYPNLSKEEKESIAREWCNLYFLAKQMFEDVSEKVIVALMDDPSLQRELMESLPNDVKKDITPYLVAKKIRDAD